MSNRWWLEHVTLLLCVVVLHFSEIPLARARHIETLADTCKLLCPVGATEAGLLYQS